MTARARGPVPLALLVGLRLPAEIVTVTPSRTVEDRAVSGAVRLHLQDSGSRPLRSFSIDLNGDWTPE